MHRKTPAFRYGNITADGIRKGEDYMSNYFVNRYGAITDVDFAPILKEVVSANSEMNSRD